MFFCIPEPETNIPNKRKIKHILWSTRAEKIKVNSKMNYYFYVNNQKKIILPTFCFLQSANTSVKARRECLQFKRVFEWRIVQENQRR